MQTACKNPSPGIFRIATTSESHATSPSTGSVWQDDSLSLYMNITMTPTQSVAVRMQDKVMWRARLGWMEGMPDWDTE